MPNLNDIKMKLAELQEEISLLDEELEETMFYNPQFFAWKMKQIKEYAEEMGDLEDAHRLADRLMINTLKELGYDLSSFETMKKWYA